MGYLRNIIADARPRQVTGVTKPVAHLYDTPAVAGGAFPFALNQRAGNRQVPDVVSEANATPDHSVKHTKLGEPSTESVVYNRAVDALEKNQEIGGEEGGGTSGRRRAVPPFGDISEKKQNVYSQSSRTASNAEEGTETSTSRPCGSRIHETEIGDEAILSGGTQCSKSTSNFLESVMTRQEISGATEELETRTSSSNGRGGKGVFLRKQSGNRPSGGFSASPPSLLPSEKDSDGGYLSQHVIDRGPQQALALGSSHSHKEIRKSENNLRSGTPQSEPEIFGNHVHKEVNQLEQSVYEKSVPQDTERKDLKPLQEREVEQPIIKIKKKRDVSLVEPQQNLPQEPKVTIGSVEIIIEAPAGPANQSKAFLPSSSMSSRRYLRRL